MTDEARRLSNENDRLFKKYGGTVVPSGKKGPKCGYPALMKYVRENNEPLPLTPEREMEIVAKILCV